MTKKQMKTEIINNFSKPINLEFLNALNKRGLIELMELMEELGLINE